MYMEGIAFLIGVACVVYVVERWPYIHRKKMEFARKIQEDVNKAASAADAALGRPQPESKGKGV